MPETPRDGRLEIEGGSAVATRLLRPRGSRAFLVLAHGAGAGMEHPFLEGLAEALGRRGVATLRFQFPYAEAGRRRPDPPRVLTGCVRAALERASKEARGLPLLVGGKSMGGRMSSMLAAREPLPGVRGLVFVGFPLHAAGKPSAERAAHLAEVRLPMLFLQGTRDRLADLEHLIPVCEGLGERALLHVVSDADHGFHVPKRTGRIDEEVREELADVIADFARRVAP